MQNYKQLKKIMLNPSIIASPSECEIIDTETISFMCTAYILWKTSCTLPQCLKILDVDFQISKHINFIQIKTKHIPKFSLSHLRANQQKIKDNVERIWETGIYI